MQAIHTLVATEVLAAVAAALLELRQVVLVITMALVVVAEL